MLTRRLFVPSLSATALALILSGGGGCLFSPEEGDPEPPPLPQILPRTIPENVIKNIEIIYEDKVRNATERRDLYAEQLGPSFLFWFQEVDQDTCGCVNWGRDEEIRAHANMFQAQDNAQIYSLRLDITASAATDLDPPEEGKPGWKEIFANNVFLELLTDPNNGFVVTGGQAEFQMQPIDNLWVIGEWRDLPRPN